MLRIAFVSLALVFTFGCAQDPPPTVESEPSPAAPVPEPVGDLGVSETRVEGQIRGTEVSLVEAEVGSELAIYEEGGWGWSPSLLVFLFRGDQGLPENETITVEGPGTTPHVHYRWRDPEEGGIEVASVAFNYELKLEFGSREGDFLPGRIEFSVPEESTSVSGTFRARIDD